MTNVNELYRKRQEVFIERRTKIVDEVNKFLDGVKGIDPALLQGIPTLPGDTAKDVLPSMWEEPFDTEKYEKELAVFNTYVKYVKEVADKINEEAAHILGGAY